MIVKNILGLVRYIAPAVGAAIASGIGAVASAGLNAASQARTNAQNRAQAEYAFRQQQAAIQRQNEYNSPVQQVLRMKAAGLNPSLAYGADGAMVGNQSEAPAYTPIPAEAPNIGNIGAGIAEAVRTGIEVKDFQRRQDLATAEIASKDWQNFLAMTQGQLNQAAAQETLTLLGYRVDSLESQTQLNWEQVLKTRQEISNLKEQKKEIQSRVCLNDAQIKELASRAGLSDTQAYAILARLPHEILQMDANAAYAWAQEAVGRAEVVKINREVSHIGFVEWQEGRNFDFQVNSKVADLEMQRYQSRVSTMNQLMNTIGLLTGAAAMRAGQPLPPSNQRHPSPIITPAGESWRQ